MYFNKLKTVFTKIFFLIFISFIILNFTYILKYKPLLHLFTGNMSFLGWGGFISLIIAFSIIIILFSTKYSYKLFNLNERLLIPILIILTFIPRYLWINVVNVRPMADFDTYHIFATAISQGRFTGNEYISLFPHYIAYPAFLSIFYHLFGSRTIIVYLLNIFFSCGITVLIYLIGCKLIDRRSGIIAAVIWAFWPSQIFYSVLVATEITFTFLILLCIYFFLRATSVKRTFTKSISLFAVLGIMSAISNSIRPIALILLAAIAIYYIYISEPFLFNKRVLLSKTIVLLTLLTSYIVTSSVILQIISLAIDRDVPKYPFGFNLYVGSNYLSSGTWNAEDSNYLFGLVEQKRFTSQEIHNILFKRGIERIKSRTLLENLTLVINKHGVMWAADHDSIEYAKAGIEKEKPPVQAFYKYEKILILLSNFYYYLILVFCMVGAIKCIKYNECGLNILPILFVSGMVIVHMMVEVAGRYHFPAISLFALLGSFGLINLNLQQDYSDTLTLRQIKTKFCG